MRGRSSARERRPRSCRIPACRGPTLALELAVEGIEAGYGAVRALHGISLSIREKETVALLGTNGNGKSTLMKCVMGMVRPTQGKIQLKIENKTHDLTRLSTEE